MKAHRAGGVAVTALRETRRRIAQRRMYVAAALIGWGTSWAAYVPYSPDHYKTFIRWEP